MTTIDRVGFAAELDAHVAAKGPITVGLAGAGQMGTDIVVQAALMTGFRIGAIAASRPTRPMEAIAMAGYEAGHGRIASGASDIDRVIEAGGIAITDDILDLCAAGRIDVVIDATGSPDIGARLALEAIRNGKHIVMLNVEADITVGRHLSAEAKRAGVVYTGSAGDEPASTLELIAFAQSLGMEIVAAGKGKNNPLDFHALPADYEEEAARRNMNARMLVEFIDGSKTMVEMTAIANCTGLVPDVAGMHGPNVTRETLAQVLCSKADGGILSRSGRVDYTIGTGVAPGVFCVVKPRHERAIERMADLKVGSGPCFALIRPFHLTSLETPLSAIRAVLHRRPDMEPVERPVAECGAVAKRDLAVGETLGRIGESDYRGWAMTWAEGRRQHALPLGLAEKARVARPIKAGDLLTHENCTADDTLLVTRIRRDLDAADQRFLA
ncbi:MULTISPECIES: NAD(P)H-dependent oxidoreductase [unclassified Aureimonas]|uniref:NAD(P)H-dependent oxidoreductase n=1 Tax=unclassified Aureimonas TaxID=2615206 RepID=UPI0006F2E74A|nr:MULTISPECIES: homoserine dehydrogenase [unclassified Aureimonas]KQT60657.1 homoserine dehydrogenase [Aureimonas sp. Leaf460]KQT68786.1 homoserine dehydrogenase [Aureimonas sp. Leaf427]